MLQFDLRTLERMLRTKPDLKKDYEKFLKSLPDEAANAEEIVMEEESKEAGAFTFSAISEV